MGSEDAASTSSSTKPSGLLYSRPHSRRVRNVAPRDDRISRSQPLPDRGTLVTRSLEADAGAEGDDDDDDGDDDDAV